MDQERRISAQAEAAVTRHFEDLGAKLVVEPLLGVKRPDFGVLDPSEGKIVAVIEVKSLTTPEFTEDLIVTEDPPKGIRRKIRDANEQLKDAEHLPCLLIIDTSSTMIPPIPSLIVEAMFGSDTLAVTHYADGSIRQALTADDNGHIKGRNVSPTNTRISAVAVIAGRTLGCEEPDLPIWMREAMKHPSSKVERDQVTEFHPVPICVCQFSFLKFIRNPHARIPWPEDLIGPWDEVYGETNEFGHRAELQQPGRMIAMVPDGCVLF